MSYSEQSDNAVTVTMSKTTTPKHQPANMNDVRRSASTLMRVSPDHTTMLLQEKASPCSNCKASYEMLCIGSEQNLIAPRYRLACVRCGHMGGYGGSIPDAIAKWNSPPDWCTQVIESIRTRLFGRSAEDMTGSMQWR